MPLGWACAARVGPPTAVKTCGIAFRATRFENMCRTTWAVRARRSTTPSRRSSRCSGAPSVGKGSALGCKPAGRRSAIRQTRFGWLARGAAFAVLALMIAPAVAHAWTPGTHVFLGEAVIRSISLLPPAVAALLSEFPYDFLYGSIAADTSIAKKYAPVGRHCHSWNVGFEIYDAARDDRLRAFGLGYLSHLAADAVAHNYFVPRQLAVTSSTSSLGHSYWESRFETHLGTECARRARELIL